MFVLILFHFKKLIVQVKIFLNKLTGVVVGVVHSALIMISR